MAKVLTPIEARVLGTLMEKARTVPDSYPLSINALVLGCNQKSSRDPLMDVSDDDARQAIESLKAQSLVFEGSSSRVPRFEHNFQRGAGVSEPQAVVIGLLMLRGPQTAAELRISGERWYKFVDTAAVEAVLQALQQRGQLCLRRFVKCPGGAGGRLRLRGGRHRRVGAAIRHFKRQVQRGQHADPRRQRARQARPVGSDGSDVRGGGGRGRPTGQRSAY